MADPNAAAVPAFARSPGDLQGIINYSSRQGLAIFGQATRSLYKDPSDMFNVESAGLQTFLALLRHHGTTSGWDFARSHLQPQWHLCEKCIYRGSMHRFIWFVLWLHWHPLWLRLLLWQQLVRGSLAGLVWRIVFSHLQLYTKEPATPQKTI